MKKTIGIIGGMGPVATCDLFRKILDVTSAHKDQDYPRIVIDSNTEIPDRTEAILRGGRDPLPQMVRSAVRLEGLGADVLLIPCNTAHYFYRELCRYVEIPVLHMPEETAREAARRGIRTVGLLATDGTVQSGVYSRALEKENIRVLVPGEKQQKSVMELIYYGIKGNHLDMDTSGFQETMKVLEEQGAETLILGCTELPVAFEYFHFPNRALDPTEILARSAVRFIGCPLKGEKRYDK